MSGKPLHQKPLPTSFLDEVPGAADCFDHPLREPFFFGGSGTAFRLEYSGAADVLSRLPARGTGVAVRGLRGKPGFSFPPELLKAGNPEGILNVYDRWILDYR